MTLQIWLCIQKDSDQTGYSTSLNNICYVLTCSWEPKLSSLWALIKLSGNLWHFDWLLNKDKFWFYTFISEINTSFHLPYIDCSIRAAHNHEIIQRSPSYTLKNIGNHLCWGRKYYTILYSFSYLYLKIWWGVYPITREWQKEKTLIRKHVLNE